MKNPNLRTLRVESFIHKSTVLAELEVVEDKGDILIVRTFANYFKKLVKDTDKNGEYYKVYDIDSKEVECPS
jgi:hypothetical protein